MNIFAKAFDSLKETAGTVVDNVSAAADVAAEFASDAREALPTGEQVRHAVGDVLIIGGKALIDPRQAAGEAAVKLGELIKPAEEA